MTTPDAPVTPDAPAPPPDAPPPDAPVTDTAPPDAPPPDPPAPPDAPLGNGGGDAPPMQDETDSYIPTSTSNETPIALPIEYTQYPPPPG